MIIAIMMTVVMLSVVASFNEQHSLFRFILPSPDPKKTTFNLNCLIHSSADIMGATTFNITTLWLMEIVC